MKEGERERSVEVDLADLTDDAPRDPDPTDAERYPTLSPHGQKLLAFMREHPNAPFFRNRSGNRLTAADVEYVRAFEEEALDSPLGWTTGGRPPPWVGPLVERCYADVPHYRRQGSPPADLAEVAPVSRADLAADIAAFVPDDVPVDRLINFRTSGTTGHPLLVASHPAVAASYLAFHKRALRRVGITLRAGRGQVGVVLIGFQRRCFTYVSVTPTMDDSGLAKLNLHPADWRDPGDRARYLDALAPEVIAGDPISFGALLGLGLTHRPRALLSTSMALGAGLRERLVEEFACPVLDLYSLNEAGPIAVADPAAGGHVLLQHRMYVEILDRAGRPVAPGARGEIALTGGFNFCLPLLRYRTGDHASLEAHGPDLVLVGLEGRAPVRFRTTRGEWLNNIEITHALQRFPLVQYRLHQAADGGVHLTAVGPLGDLAPVARALEELFGKGPAITVAKVSALEDKVMQYSSDLPGARE